jgi:diguanylate cyclase (GGDEF)-like protein
VHILDETQQHRVASTGAPLGNHPCEDSMCRLVVDGDERIVCADAGRDDRFGYSSLVQGPMPVRFYASFPLRTRNGVVIGTLCAFDTKVHKLSDEQIALVEDLADQVSTQVELTHVAAELSQLAAHDPLTGAVNRVLLSDRLAQASARQTRHGGQIVLAVIDVDNLEHFNDNLGPDAGDDVLIGIARRLISVVRTSDTVARTGGDEFAVLAETDQGYWAARRLVERVEEALQEPIEVCGHPMRVRASIGCVLVETGEDIRSALERADAAMSQRKLAAAGR